MSNKKLCSKNMFYNISFFLPVCKKSSTFAAVNLTQSFLPLRLIPIEDYMKSAL